MSSSSHHHSRRDSSRDDRVKRDGEKHRERSPVERNNGNSVGNRDNTDVPGEDTGSEQVSKNKIASRCRLFVGNLNNDLKESELRELFEKYGDITEFFMSASKGFAFVRLDTRAHAETAKENLDGATVKGRQIRVRYAVHGASLKVSELSSTVSNELLAQAFSMFGVVERAVHILDDRSQPTGEGVIEFERKPAAIDAIRRINEGVFLITAGNKPLFVEPLEPKDDEDGLSERMVPKSGPYQKERSQPPRFAVPGSFEFEFGNRWKELYRIERIRREQLERELKDAREKLESEVDFAYQEYQAAQLREDLRRRQEELERLEASRRKSMELYRQREEEKARFKQQQQQMLPPSGVPPPFAVHQRPPPNFLNQPPPLSGHQPIDNRISEALRNEAMARRSMEGPPPGSSPVTHGQRPDDKLVNGVQKLMQLMQQAASNRASDSRPPIGAAPTSPYEMQQRQLHQQHNMQSRPNLLNTPFMDEKDRRGRPPNDPDRNRMYR